MSLSYEEVSQQLKEKIDKSSLFNDNLTYEENLKYKEQSSKNDIRLLFKAVGSGDENTTKEFIKFININECDAFGGTLLHHAASGNDLNIIKILLENKADINAKDQNGWTPLHTACVNANINICSLLLEHKADATIQNTGGNVPLHYFVRSSSESIAKNVLYYQCLSNLVQNSEKCSTNLQGETPLHLAALRGNAESIRLYLICSKSDLNCTSNNGETPLHYAVRSGRLDVVNCLLQLGADIEISGKHGNAMQLAVTENQHEILDVLNENVLQRKGINSPVVLLTQEAETIRDRYGFPLQLEQVEKYEQYDCNYVTHNENRKKAWSKFLSQKNLTDKVNNKSSTLQILLKKGIAKENRGEIWYRLVTSKIGNPPDGYYDRLLKKKIYPFNDDIKKDVPRTYPSHSFFSSESSKNTVKQVLLAYSIRNPSVGYCQSMNFLVGTLLLNMSEKCAFWVLRYIVEDLLDDYFVQSMLGLSIDQKVLEALVQDEIPKLHNHLDSLSFPLCVFTTRWFMCIFLNTLPTETSMRIWDLFLYEGARIIILVSFTILKLHEKALLSAKNTHQLMYTLDNITSTAFNVEEIIEETCKNYNLLSDNDLHERRLRFWNIVQKERDIKTLQVMYMQQDRTYFSKLPTSYDEDSE